MASDRHRMPMKWLLQPIVAAPQPQAAPTGHFTFVGGERTPLDQVKVSMGRQIGDGGFGTVWEALLTPHGIPDGNQSCAVKQIQAPVSEMEARMREVLALQELRHDNIVKFLGYKCFDGTIKIFMELMATSFKSIFEKLKSVKRAVAPPQLFAQLDGIVKVVVVSTLRALMYSFERNMLHNDIKPANILLSADGVVKLADFGLVTTLNSRGYAYDNLGTAVYLPPEALDPQMAQSYRHDCRSDIWSLAITALTLRLLRDPYPGDMLAVLYALSQGLLPEVPQDIDANLRSFLLACLQPKARRPKYTHKAQGPVPPLEDHPILKDVLLTAPEVREWYTLLCQQNP